MPQQMNVHLAKLSQTYNHELVMTPGGQGVNMDRVLYSLFSCVSKYSDEVQRNTHTHTYTHTHTHTNTHLTPPPLLLPKVVESLEASGLLHQMQTLISIKSVVT